MTTRKQRSRAQHRHDLAVREARRNISAVVAETERPPRRSLPPAPAGEPPAIPLTYRGDRTGVDPVARYGPDDFGGWYRAISADYDPDTNRTVLGFAPIFTRKAS